MVLGVGLILAAAACSQPAASMAPSQAPTSQAPTSQAPTSGAPASAAAAGPGLAEVCAKAQADEGALVHWNNHSDRYPAVIEAFEAAYPGIDVQNLTLSPDEQAQRILTEVTAGRQPSTDLGVGEMNVFKPLLDRGTVDTSIDWAALGVPSEVITPNNIVRLERVTVGLGYNTEVNSAADLPNTWEDLIDAKWAGRVVVDPRGRPFDSLGLVWGKDATLDYVQRLKDIVQPIVIEGGTAGMVAVIGGEADFTTSGRSESTLEQQAEGAPIALKYLDLIPTLDNNNFPLLGAAHPNAAICFVGWLATAGQELYNETEFKRNDTIPPDAPADVQVVSVDTPEQAAQVQELSELIQPIWTGS